jgi:transcriptional regulator with XRE-family HTH domain
MKLFTILGRRASFPWTDRLVGKLKNREYRDAFVAEGVKAWVARQIRTLREQRKLSQGDLGALCDKLQSAISRLEDPDYGQMSLQTLLELASAFDVALVVKFVDYPTFLRETKDMSTINMHVDSFSVNAFASVDANNIIISSPHAFSAAERMDKTVDMEDVGAANNNFGWMNALTSGGMGGVAIHG